VWASGQKVALTGYGAQVRAYLLEQDKEAS
jgi:hypothetical protein